LFVWLFLNGLVAQGIKFLIEQGIITDTPESIADFLHSTGKSSLGLDKTALGDYLGEGDKYNIAV
jgi:brefeldin A-inhibited guanine nucleotide-exchange protein